MASVLMQPIDHGPVMLPESQTPAYSFCKCPTLDQSPRVTGCQYVREQWAIWDAEVCLSKKQINISCEASLYWLMESSVDREDE